MVKRNKFMSLFESAMNRYQRGGFLIGDVLKFNDNFKSQSEYGALGDNVKEFIDQMIESGLNIKVVGIKDDAPQRFPAGNNSSSLQVVLDIALDNTGGRFTHHCSIPCCLGQPGESPYPNLDPIPDEVRRKDKVNIKPEEVVEDEESLSNKTDRGDGQLSQTERKLPHENKEIPSTAATPSMEVNSYTKDYLNGLSR
jgi:hypothetical protein